MQLKYLKHREGTKHFVYGGPKMDAFSVSPIGEVPDSIAVALIKSRPDDYAMYLPEAVSGPEISADGATENEQVVCELCGKELKTQGALILHKKFKHKG